VIKHFAVNKKKTSKSSEFFPEQSTSVSSIAYHCEIFIFGSADRAGVPCRLIYLNKESLYLARSHFNLYRPLSFIVVISHFLLTHRHHWCLYFWYVISPSTAAKTTMICLFLTRSLIVWISLRIFQHRECHLYSYLRVKNHRCRYLLIQIQSRSCHHLRYIVSNL